MSRVAVEGLSKRFATTVALDEVSVTVEDGGLTALLGPSGSGKTTLLRCIAGFVTPDRGSIRFDADRVDEVPPHRRAIGMVFQSYALFPHLTVARNVGFGLEVRGEPSEARVAEMLALVALGELAQRRPRELSGGQQQRVALARALAPRPRVLLLDEPLSALDRRLRQTMQLELRTLIRRLGITTIMVTHDQEEALTMADRIVVLSDGRVVQEGTPMDVYERPRTAFAATFLGDANLLDGGRRAVRPERVRLLAAGDTALPGLAATIRETVYAGPVVTYLCEAGGQTLRAVATNTGQPTVPPGTEVRLGWEPSDAVELVT